MRTFAVISALSVAAALPAPAPAPVSFPVANGRSVLTRDDGSANIPAILANFNRTLTKYHKDPLPYYSAIADQQEQQGLLGLGVLGLKKRGSGSESLTDEVDEGVDDTYYGPITVGKNSQKFTTIFDTGSSDLFLPGPSCNTSQGCTHSTKYDQSGTDQKRTTSVTYGSGSISGNDYSDKVTIAGLTATNQTLISLSNAQGFSTIDSDGLLGMGFSEIAQTGSPTYFENLMSEGAVDAPEFAFFLGREKSGTATKSTLTLGGRDSSLYHGTPTSVAVTTPGYWQVALDSVYVNGASAGLTTEGQAAIDTGTTLVLAPTDSLVAIALAIPGAIPLPMGQETLLLYPCSTSDKYVPAITFAGKQFQINPVDFNLGTVSSALGVDLGNNTLSNILEDAIDTYCVAAVVGDDLSPTENLYVVGDTFLKNWYSIYSYANNKPSVSFAPAKINNQ